MSEPKLLTRAELHALNMKKRSAVSGVEIDRLIETAKQGVEDRERDQRVRTTGPGPLLLRLCERFDALLSLDHKPARQASEVYDEAFHIAVHALHDLRAFARIISPTWRGAADAAAAVERGVRVCTRCNENPCRCYTSESPGTFGERGVRETPEVDERLIIFAFQSGAAFMQGGTGIFTNGVERRLTSGDVLAAAKTYASRSADSRLGDDTPTTRSGLRDKSDG